MRCDPWMHRKEKKGKENIDMMYLLPPELFMPYLCFPSPFFFSFSAWCGEPIFEVLVTSSFLSFYRLCFPLFFFIDCALVCVAWVEGLSETATDVPPLGRGYVCMHSTLPRSHMWYTLVVVHWGTLRIVYGWDLLHKNKKWRSWQCCKWIVTVLVSLLLRTCYSTWLSVLLIHTAIKMHVYAHVLTW